MGHETVNIGKDITDIWHTSSAGDLRSSKDNHYLDWLNDMRVGFYESGDYGGDWAGGGSGVDVETTFPSTPSNGVLFVRYNTVTNVLRGYRYDGSGWIPIGNEDKQKFFNGTFKETFTALITESSGTVTLTVQQDATGDLTMRFSDGETTLDCTPALTIELTVGTDKAPTLNYIYVLQSTKVLTKDTSNWPTTEHIKIGKFLIPSAAFVSANGAYTNHNFNDHAFGTNNQGHDSHLGERSRKFGAAWDSGVAGAGTTDYLTIAGATVTFKSTVGVVYQMHSHAVSAFDSSVTKMLVVNEPGTSYNDINNLYDLTQDSATGTLLNKWFNLIIIGVANQTGEFSAFLIKLPDGTYVTQAQAEDDTMNFNNYDIPDEFIGVAFLICRITVQKTGSTFMYGSFKSLLGVSSQIAGGSSFSTLTEFLDSQFKIQNAVDPTKEIDFDASGITTGNKRTVTMPDIDVTLHNAIIAGDLNHNDLANIDDGDINHLTDAQLGDLHAAVVAGDLNHNDLSNIDDGDINHLTDDQVTALHAEVSTLTHTALTGKNDETDINHLTDAQLVALDQKVQSAFFGNIIYSNGAIPSGLNVSSVISLPAGDPDAGVRFTLMSPESVTTTPTLKIAYYISTSGAFSIKLSVEVRTTGSTHSSQNFNVLNESTSWDFPAGTANQVYHRSITLSNANFVALGMVGVEIKSDTSNGGQLVILGMWLEW